MIDLMTNHLDSLNSSIDGEHVEYHFSVMYCGQNVIDVKHYDPQQEDKSFNFQSVSKQFIKRAIAKKFGKTNEIAYIPILDYFFKVKNGKPNLKFYDSKWWELSILELLSHDSGIPDFINEIYDFETTDNYKFVFDEYDVLKAVSKLPLHQGRHYSNTNYYLLYKAFEKEVNELYGNLLLNTYNEKRPAFILENEKLIPANKWNDSFNVGLMRGTVKQLHDFSKSIDKDIVEYFTPKWNTINVGHYNLAHTVIGAADTGTIVIHSFNVERDFSMVLYCNVFNDDLLSHFVQLGSEIIYNYLKQVQV